jgi:hypothetical protein
LMLVAGVATVSYRYEGDMGRPKLSPAIT